MESALQFANILHFLMYDAMNWMFISPQIHMLKP